MSGDSLGEPLASQDLIAWRENTYSQWGEDGILAEILRRLAIDDGWFVEFGAWDGRHLSNTRRLYELGWSGVYIEGDPDKYDDLRREYEGVDRIVALNAWVGSHGDRRLDTILAGTPVPLRFEVLSIDIEGDDYIVWDAVRSYEPAIVIVETNQTFPFNVDFVQAPGASVGNSALAMTRLAVAKGYTLVCYNMSNGIYVRDDLAYKLELPRRSFAYLFHIGRQSGVGGYFASEYGGRWHFLHRQNVAWDSYKLFKTPRKLEKLAHRFEHWSDADQIRVLFDPEGLSREEGV